LCEHVPLFRLGVFELRLAIAELVAVHRLRLRGGHVEEQLARVAIAHDPAGYFGILGRAEDPRLVFRNAEREIALDKSQLRSGERGNAAFHAQLSLQQTVPLPLA
jgi:hypothetical protein